MLGVLCRCTGWAPTVLFVDLQDGVQPGWADLHWNSGTGQYFTVEYSTNLAHGMKAVFRSNIAAHATSSMIAVPMTNDRCYYRIKLE